MFIQRSLPGGTLDLVLTSNPSLITNTSIVSGMSDHKTITFQINLKPVRPKKPPCKVYCYKAANWENLRKDLDGLTDEYKQRVSMNHSVNLNWLFFKDKLQSLINIHVPHLFSNNKPHLPYITKQIKRLMQKRDKAHAKNKKHQARKTNKDSVT